MASRAKYELDLSVVTPLLNEEESLAELEERIRKVAEQQGYRYEIIMIDDGSTDGSWEEIQRLHTKNPQVRGIRFRRNYGKSAALNEGFAITRGRVVMTMDADLQDQPEEIPEFYEMIVEQGLDLVSGWKQKRHDPISKTIPTKLYNAATRAMSGIYLHDFNCGFKAYRAEVVKSIEVYGEMHRYIPVIAKAAGFKNIGEKVVEHAARKHGKSKFGLERFINGFLDLLSITFVSRFSKRPMHFFGTLGTLFFFIGFLILAYLTFAKIVWADYGMTSRPIFYLGLLTVILGTQLFLAGFLAELISRNAPNRNQYLVADRLGQDD